MVRRYNSSKKICNHSFMLFDEKTQPFKEEM
jgi:hypothetical protein